VERDNLATRIEDQRAGAAAERIAAMPQFRGLRPQSRDILAKYLGPMLSPQRMME
jgi:hypothetical protein